MTETVISRQPHRSIVAFLPVGLFGSTMGLTGLSVAWRQAQIRYEAPPLIADTIGLVALLTFAALVIGYAAKVMTAPAAVVAEFRHPVAGNLFGTVFISLLLIPIVLAPYSLLLAQAIWLIGAVGMVVFAWTIVSRWMSDRQVVAHATPAWIVPVVGMLDLPLALPSLGLPPMHGVMVLGLAVGLFFAIPIFTLVFSRLLFEEPLPPALQPSLMILIAPFAVGFSTYVVTTGQIDLLAESLYVLSLFMLVVLVGRLRHAATCCPFNVSWWAISFPLAATAIAGIRFATAAASSVADVIALLLLGFATLAVLALLARTLWGMARGELAAMSS
ncbi:putative C4-dicarboxylate transporter/malic acid transport protein [Aurantimonas manganoxydans SI85-9A1]|uniref:Putative C4-dicarboxylate transporter/malic acid transport protein n=1 Tax=Aurantimonas manganoxydans (strain ATCC BAA-1229 / DSM 21871 / SI85-9A1) TaxID=287752 RepID=Q1YGQ7_AURMS|nr:SLAC1 anion channel family protein [Aurantimonas manganoxydans]EAS49168.1 putative C4-dicarboxylate transporter/malic acid transport protein [Aurantimonas manganoxydans SI85-9A1]